MCQSNPYYSILPFLDFNKEEIDVVKINQPIEMELDQCILKVVI